MATSTRIPVHVLSAEEWRSRAARHRERAEVWTRPHRSRRSRRESHPVYDFLFQYYTYPPSRLENWQPGLGQAVAACEDSKDRFGPPYYRCASGQIELDPGAVRPREVENHRAAFALMRSTRHSPANFGCYGVHEWAMAYGGHDVRHEAVAPLRLAQADVDAFVRDRSVVCTHFDAFRFFAPEAKALNLVELRWERRHEAEQPGCIHANMDLYRWAYEAMPWIGSDLVMDCFELAVELRVLDMRASPYDLTAFGFEPVRIETERGRATYRRRQRELAGKAGELRDRMVAAFEMWSWVRGE